MKVRMTVDVPDNARLYIAGIFGDPDQRAMATREAVRSYLQNHVTAIAEDASALSPGPLMPEEIREAREAVEYLRSQNKNDTEIRAWLLMQRARMHVSLLPQKSQADFEFDQPLRGHSLDEVA